MARSRRPGSGPAVPWSITFGIFFVVALAAVSAFAAVTIMLISPALANAGLPGAPILALGLFVGIVLDAAILIGVTRHRAWSRWIALVQLTLAAAFLWQVPVIGVIAIVGAGLPVLVLFLPPSTPWLRGDPAPSPR